MYLIQTNIYLHMYVNRLINRWINIFIYIYLIVFVKQTRYMQRFFFTNQIQWFYISGSPTISLEELTSGDFTVCFWKEPFSLMICQDHKDWKWWANQSRRVEIRWKPSMIQNDSKQSHLCGLSNKRNSENSQIRAGWPRNGEGWRVQEWYDGGLDLLPGRI